MTFFLKLLGTALSDPKTSDADPCDQYQNDTLILLSI